MQVHKMRPTQTFLHGYNRYERDVIYEVEEGLALYAVMNGWAECDTVKPPGFVIPPEQANYTLDIDNGSHGVTDTNDG